jgi:hypothetical protein
MAVSLQAWPLFLLALLVYGFAPGLLLRLIVRAFHPEDPRREELLAEIHGVPRLERPFWVFEQLEVAISEGLWGRIVWAATGRVIDRWRLGSGVERNRHYPDSFEIPTEEAKCSIQPGDRVRLLFELKDGWCERMWVSVSAIKRRNIVGELINTPAGIPRLDPGDTVVFTHDHVIDIDWRGWAEEDDGVAPAPTPT